MKLESTVQTNPDPKAFKSDEDGEVCIANINSAGRQYRLRFGIVQLAIALTGLGVLLALHANPLWRLLLLLPFWAATVGYFQWRDKTCVKFAREGVFELNGGVEKMDDSAQLAQVRKQARRVMVKAFFAAVVLTALTFIIPG